MKEIEQYLQAGDIKLRAKDIKISLEEHNNMKQDIKRLKEDYILLQNASDEVEEDKHKEIERLKEKYLEAIDKYEQEYYKNIKAIEYIEAHQLNFKKGTTTFGSERLSMEERKLIDILRGVDKE